MACQNVIFISDYTACSSHHNNHTLQMLKCRAVKDRAVKAEIKILKLYGVTVTSTDVDQNK
jgi:hypothetical protein